MPTYRGIDISLQSQFDALKIPEYLSRSTPLSDQHSPHSSSSFNSFRLSSSKDASKPPAIDLYIPNYPGSQFWICYACTPPHSASDIRYFYFKLLVGGRTVASWGVGERQQWCGKTMFAPCDGGKDHDGNRVREKRGLFFPPVGSESEAGVGFVEVQVFRAKARRRDVARYEKMSPSSAAGGVRLISTGEVKKGEPQRMYEYALKDPVERPYVTIRYHCRTHEQLDELGCITPETGPPTPPPHSGEASPFDNDDTLEEVLDNEESTTIDSPPRRLLRKLSFPPSQHFAPVTTSHEPSSPRKQQLPWETDDEPGHDYNTLAISDDVFVPAERSVSRHDWATSTASPVGAEEGVFVGTGLLSPLKNTRKGSKSLLSGLVASATRRKGARSATPDSKIV